MGDNPPSPSPDLPLLCCFFWRGLTSLPPPYRFFKCPNRQWLARDLVVVFLDDGFGHEEAAARAFLSAYHGTDDGVEAEPLVVHAGVILAALGVDIEQGAFAVVGGCQQEPAGRDMSVWEDQPLVVAPPCSFIRPSSPPRLRQTTLIRSESVSTEPTASCPTLI